MGLCKGAVNYCYRLSAGCAFRPVFNAVMKQTLNGYQVITSLCGHGDTNSSKMNLNFRHIAVAYQRYCEESNLLAENQQERHRRMKFCTKFIGAVVSKVMSQCKASSVLAYNLDMLSILQCSDDAGQHAAFSSRSAALVSGCCQQ